jgi:hypothetical protein
VAARGAGPAAGRWWLPAAGGGLCRRQAVPSRCCCPRAAGHAAEQQASCPPSSTNNACLVVRRTQHTPSALAQPQHPAPLPPQLLGRLTKRHANAAQVAAAGGPRLLLSLPRSCLGVQFWRLEPLLSAILRNLLEDPATLEAWMEAEIRSHLTAQVGATAGRRAPVPVGPGPLAADAVVGGACMASLGARQPTRLHTLPRPPPSLGRRPPCTRTTTPSTARAARARCRCPSSWRA